MTSWRIETSPEFDKVARKLDRSTLRRVKTLLEAISALEDPRSRGRGLSGNRAGFWRYRVGDYRVIVSIIDDERRLIAIGLGHRSEVY